MPTPRTKLNVVIPDYPRPKSGNSKKGPGPGLGWRRQIHAAVLAKVGAQTLTYLRQSKLDVSVLLFMTDRQLCHGHDLDNMTKHLLDALQGKLGDAGKTEQDHRAIVPSDAQVCRLTIETRERKTKTEKSRMIVQAYRPSARRGLV